MLNQVARKNVKGIDITIDDIMKCFDKLWASECLNDLFENCLQNDKLCLLHLENIDAKVAITNTWRNHQKSNHK